MKILLSDDWYGWTIPSELEGEFFHQNIFTNPELRFNERIIEWVENNPGIDKCALTNVLGVYEVPDEATDFQVLEYDGLEDCAYVIDGKINWIKGDVL